MPRLRFVVAAAAFFALTSVTSAGAQEAAAARPNVLWIWAEDMSPLLGCYGAPNETPALDAFAKRAVVFERTYTPTPVCSTCRSSMMVGAYASTFGLHNHRSSRRPAARINLPDGVKTLPELMRAAGYYTFNLGGKHDYNFVHDLRAMFDSPDGKGFYRPGKAMPWRNRKDGQPFFGIIQVQGGKERRQPATPTDPKRVSIPAYYADHPSVRSFYTRQYDSARVTDDDFKHALAELEKDGLRENTLLVFFTDHGMRSVRDKQFCYDGGLHVPFIMAWPARKDLLPPGTRRPEITSALDLVATTLYAAGVPIPRSMECRTLLGKTYRPRRSIVAIRDRCDFTIDRIRGVRTDRFRYVRNQLTDRPYTQPNYKDVPARQRPGAVFHHIAVMKDLYAKGSLSPGQAWFWADHRPAEELYDHTTDKDETKNLASDPEFAAQLAYHRGLLDAWIEQTDDQGQYPEPFESLKATMQRWRERCVNPEYDAVKKRFPDLAKPREGRR